MKGMIFAGAAVLLLAASPAYAAGDNCANAQTQRDLDECAGADYTQADAELNQAYSQLMDHYDAHNKDLLRQAERDWIKYRDSTCAHETAESEGGSMHPMLVSQCLAEKTRQRTHELRKQINCGEGDLSCNPL